MYYQITFERDVLAVPEEPEGGEGQDLELLGQVTLLCGHQHDAVIAHCGINSFLKI